MEILEQGGVVIGFVLCEGNNVKRLISMRLTLPTCGYIVSVGEMLE
jgi:hypothetical protein